MRERGRKIEFADIVEEMIEDRVKVLIGPMIDYKEAVESGDAVRTFQTESLLRDIMPKFSKAEVDEILRIKK
jgi:hypothetical protein